MGSKNSKEKEKDPGFTGPMGIMHDKYGSAATHQCQKWIKLGFPEKGTFSLNQIEKLKALLRAHEVKNNNKRQWNPDWTAVALWQKETLSRQVKQARGEIKINTAGSPPGNSVLSPVTSVCQPSSSLYPDLQQLASIHKVNMDLECPVCPPAYVPQPQAAASTPHLQAADSTSEQQRGPIAGPAPSTASGSTVSYSSATGQLQMPFSPIQTRSMAKENIPDTENMFPDSPVNSIGGWRTCWFTLFTVRSWSLPRKRWRTRSCAWHNSRPTRETRVESSDRREAVEEVKGVEAGDRGQGRGQDGGQEQRPQSAQDFDVCYNCGLKGHWARGCRAPKNRTMSGNWDNAPSGDVSLRYPGGQPGFQDAWRFSGEKEKHEEGGESGVFLQVSTPLDLPIWPIEVHGRTLNFVVDTGAGVSVISAKQWDDVPPPVTEKTMLSSDAGGGSTLERFTVPLVVKDIQADSEIHLKHAFLFSPVCPVNLLGRDLMCKLGMFVKCTGDGLVIDRFQSVLI